MTSHHKNSNNIIYILCLTVLTLLLEPARATSVLVNPHWTGKHCSECHVRDKAPELQFSGEIVKLCNRCHGDVPSVCAKVHITNSILPDTMKGAVPAGWPQMDSKLTCLTCHAVQLQMYENESEEKDNAKFLRGGKPFVLFGFCFNCHREEYFQRTNPHQLGVSSGGRPPCFRCHTHNLVSGFETSFRASVKTNNPSLCIGCHWTLVKDHINHVLLDAETLSEKEAILRGLEQEGIDLPLPDGRMHCATCHNPHPPGIIGRKEAAMGAGEKHFLRIPDLQTLCGGCHADGSVDQKIQRFRQKQQK